MSGAKSSKNVTNNIVSGLQTQPSGGATQSTRGVKIFIRLNPPVGFRIGHQQTGNYSPWMPWKKMFALVTGEIDKSLRQKLDFVLEENRVFRALLDRHSPSWRLNDTERKNLAWA